MDNHNNELEQRVAELIREKEENDRRLLALEWVIGAISLIVLLVPILIGALAPMDDRVRIALVFCSFIPAMVGFGVALKIEQVAGYYRCKECGHCHVPTFKAVCCAMHMGRTRRLKCPKCGKKSWQKKVISKE